MGVLGFFATLTIGGICGAYVAQNYPIPNIRQKLEEYGVDPPEKYVEKYKERIIRSRRPPSVERDVGVQTVEVIKDVEASGNN